MLLGNIEAKVREVLLKKGRGGWLRVQECAKEIAYDPIAEKWNGTKRTNFYRFRKKVEKKKVKGFQVVNLPKNISFIGLDSADPSVIESFISKDRRVRLASFKETMKNRAFEDGIKLRSVIANQDPDDLERLPEATMLYIQTYPFLNDNMKAERANLESLIERSIPTRPTDFLSMVEQRDSLIRIAKGDVPKILEKAFRLLHES